MKIKLKLVGVIRDGGTWVYYGSDRRNYYIDNRMNSSNKGSIYDHYPQYASAQLDINDFEIIKDSQ